MSNYQRTIELINNIEELKNEMNILSIDEITAETSILVDKLKRRLAFDKKRYYKKLDLLTD